MKKNRQRRRRRRKRKRKKKKKKKKKKQKQKLKTNSFILTIKRYETGNKKGNYTVYADDLFANYTIQWITQAVQSENYPIIPFFFYAAFTIPHAGAIGSTDEDGEPVPSPVPYQNETWPSVEIDFAAMITSMHWRRREMK
jgi:hypothetical protein